MRFLLKYVIVLISIFILTGMINYTPDWHIYEHHFNLDYSVSEFLFYFLKDIVVFFKGDFKSLHQLYISLTTSVMLFFISRFTKSLWFVSLIFLSCIIVFFTTQLRFYFSLNLVFLAIYFWYIKNNRISGVIVLMIAFLNHQATILFLPIILLLRFNLNSIRYLILIAAIFTPLLFYLITSTVINERLLTYFVPDQSSSLLGSLFNILPYLIIFLIIEFYFRPRIIKKNLQYDRQLNILLKLAYSAYIYLPIALNFQIVARRFIYPTLLIQILLTLRYYLITEKRELKSMIFWFSFTSLHMIYIYFLPQLIWGRSERLENLILIFLSHDLLL